MTARNSANESSSTEPVRSIPALLTSTSIGPPSFTMRSMPSLTDPSESTSMAEIVIGSFSLCCKLRELGCSTRIVHRCRDLVASSAEGEGGGQANSRAGSRDEDRCHAWSSPWEGTDQRALLRRILCFGHDV